jgi:carboxylesterase
VEHPFALGPQGAERPALLCLHGLCGTPHDLRWIAEQLAERGFRCEGPLLPGHGTRMEELATTPSTRWLEAALAAYDQLAERHARVYVAGLSMGGLLSLALCGRRSPAGAIAMAAPLWLSWSARVGSSLLRPFIESIERVPGVLDPEARRQNPGYRRMPLAAVHELKQLQAAVRAQLGRVQAPLLLIYSQRDQTVHPANAASVAGEVGSERVETCLLERSGHVLTVDYERERVAARMGDFLAKLETREGGN